MFTKNLPRAYRLLGALSLCLGSIGAQAQVAPAAITMAGNYQNFDVLNGTGGETCGFEMEVHGVSAADVFRIFPSNFNQNVIRYGFGTATDFPGGVYIRWTSPYDKATSKFTNCTPVPKSLTTVPGDSCWTLGMPSTYATAGCEHFGISATKNPSNILYRWLIADPAIPGNLKSVGTDISMPAPAWVGVPPAGLGLPAVVQAEIPAPPPPPARFGDAQWVKVYKNEMNRKIDLDELVGDNPLVVPADAAHVEVQWDLLQADPPGGNQRRRGKLANQGNLGNGNHAVIRRYEFYKYAGRLDPITNEALCADLTCTAPGPGELGDAIGAQNAAANLDVNDLTITLVGGGRVSSSDKVMDCGSKCYGIYNPNTVVSLTAKANSSSTFALWSGACSGAAATCNVTMSAAKSVTATFITAAGGGGGGGATSPTLSVKTSGGKGVITSASGTINCGNVCSATLAAGSVVKLTATPDVGFKFVSWTGACTGATATCTFTLNSSVTAQANFTK